MVRPGASGVPGTCVFGSVDFICKNLCPAKSADHCYVFLPLCSEVGRLLDISFIFLLHHLILASLSVSVSYVLNPLQLTCFCRRSLIYPFLIRGGKPTPFASFALAFVFCIYNGYMQIRYLSHYAEYPAHWVTHPCFIAGTCLVSALPLSASQTRTSACQDDTFSCQGNIV